ncbi:hypothetical protein ACVWWG_006052 [Bradyrhizobium sp. LB7.2]
MMAMPLLAASDATLATTAWCELATTARPRKASWFSERSGVLSLGAWAAPRSKAWTSVPLLTDSASVALVPRASTLVFAPLI